jgi:hypothetical protein
MYDRHMTLQVAGREVVPMARSVRDPSVSEAKYAPDQPRDHAGRFGTGPGQVNRRIPLVSGLGKVNQAALEYIRTGAPDRRRGKVYSTPGLPFLGRKR